MSASAKVSGPWWVDACLRQSLCGLAAKRLKFRRGIGLAVLQRALTQRLNQGDNFALFQRLTLLTIALDGQLPFFDRVRATDFFAQLFFYLLSELMHVLDRKADQTGNFPCRLTAQRELHI